MHCIFTYKNLLARALLHFQLYLGFAIRFPLVHQKFPSFVISSHRKLNESIVGRIVDVLFESPTKWDIKYHLRRLANRNMSTKLKIC